ncbi:MAG: type III pantothenate kinase [Pseudanabaenaceae cyanobacterium SKYGB_i_bin29]|nr:type III pantothenate kinase [Pseudanabaenaceae cyanobacterium SKYG29]MDW8421177.1 type III pantothenate kinase [Pseudanabaenaceae cyanobacterium SKYGB_i_bin29]
MTENWLALNLGNSRLHWAILQGKTLLDWGDDPYDRLLPLNPHQFHRILIASVNPRQLSPWANLPHSKVLTLADVPLPHSYPTLGIDRALAAWGAIHRYGTPVLVIDCGTAITLTAIDELGNLAGGAIFPGIEILRQSYRQRLPHLPTVPLPDQPPPLWSHNTPGAIASGMFHFIAAGLHKFINDRSCLTLFTGGDGQYWQQHFPSSHFDPHLVFWGMAEL